jgi:DNA-binding protein Fis
MSSRGTKKRIKNEVNKPDDSPYEDILFQLRVVVRSLIAALDAVKRLDVLRKDQIDFRAQVAHFEVRLISTALSYSRGNQAKASTMLNLNSATLCAKFKKYKIDVGRFK